MNAAANPLSSAHIPRLLEKKGKCAPGDCNHSSSGDAAFRYLKDDTRCGYAGLQAAAATVSSKNILRTWGPGLSTTLTSSVAAIALLVLFVELVNLRARFPAPGSILFYSAGTIAYSSSRNKILHSGSLEDRSSKFPSAGVAAYSLVVVGAYRRGPSAWEVLILAGGLVAKDDVTFYVCGWYPAHPPAHSVYTAAAPAPAPVLVKAVRVEKPGFRDRLTYTPVVITCEFSSPVGADGLGGALVLFHTNSSSNIGGGELYAGNSAKVGPEDVTEFNGSGSDDEISGEDTTRVVAGTEHPGVYNASKFEGSPSYQYQHLYCGSPLYGDLNGQGLYEWVSFHFHQFGHRSHFVFHDVGGISQDPRRLLAPWIDLGILEIEDVRRLNQFDGYYYNQYLILNDCLLRSRHLAEWVWFFDVDEYIVVKPPFANINALVDKYRDKGELQFVEHLFSNTLCALPAPTASRMENSWTIEALLFAVKGGPSHTKCKWAGNPRKVSTASVHFAMNGGRHSKRIVNSSEASYFHYHNTIDKSKADLCQRWVKQEEYGNLHAQLRPGMEEQAHEYDASMLPLARRARLESALFLNNNKRNGT